MVVSDKDDHMRCRVPETPIMDERGLHLVQEDVASPSPAV